MKKKIKVSIVEDIDDIREAFAFLVKSKPGYELIGSYANGEDALDALDLNKPDVIIMDIGLPGISGIECTGLVKKRYPEIQILICSVFEDDQRLFAALKAGANGYILKQTPPVAFLQSIKEIHEGGAPMTSHIARKVIAVMQENNNKSSGWMEKYNLTGRELEILSFIVNGFRNKDIAEKLFISQHTVKSHIYNIYEKLHVKSRVEVTNKFSGSL